MRQTIIYSALILSFANIQAADLTHLKQAIIDGDLETFEREVKARTSHELSQPIASSRDGYTLLHLVALMPYKVITPSRYITNRHGCTTSACQGPKYFTGAHDEHLCARYLTMCDLLLNKNVAVDVLSSQGTPLHCAVQRHPIMCEKLLQHGAYIDAQNFESHTPLELIINLSSLYMKHYTRIVDVLINAGATLHSATIRFPEERLITKGLSRNDEALRKIFAHAYVARWLKEHHRQAWEIVFFRSLFKVNKLLDTQWFEPEFERDPCDTVARRRMNNLVRATAIRQKCGETVLQEAFITALHHGYFEQARKMSKQLNADLSDTEHEAWVAAAQAAEVRGFVVPGGTGSRT